MSYNTKMTALKTENLHIGYRSKKQNITIASNINITLQQGELVGLVGTNGIGKSTLLKTLTQVLAPLSGNVLIKEKNSSQYSSNRLARVLSLVLTEKLASKNLKVLELVALGRQPYTNWVGNLSKTDLPIINKALQLTNTVHLKHKRCFELSDGQLQNVMIARALAQDTDIMVLDEPTTHLDMYHKAYILKLLKKLSEETQKTILFSSHDINLSLQLCDKIIVMTKENVVIGTPKDLIQQGIFKTLFPKDLIIFDDLSARFRMST